MIKIAICDNEPPICEKLKACISSYSKVKKEKIVVQIFPSGESLYEHIKTTKGFDLIFLDIELDALSGVDVGRIIREELNDNITQILYISAKQEYAIKLFEYRPLNFLVKPLIEEQIFDSLALAIEIGRKGDLVFEFSDQNGFHRIPFKDIMYFQSENKRINIVTPKETFTSGDKLSNIVELVKDFDFVTTHKSYLMNFSYVSHTDGDDFVLTNGARVPISRSHRKEINDFLHKRKMNRG